MESNSKKICRVIERWIRFERAMNVYLKHSAWLLKKGLPIIVLLFFLEVLSITSATALKWLIVSGGFITVFYVVATLFEQNIPIVVRYYLKHKYGWGLDEDKKT